MVFEEIIGCLEACFIPICLTAFFIISLVRYLMAKKGVKNNTGKYDGQDVQDRKTMLIISAVLFLVMVLVAVCFIALLMIAIANM